MPSPNPFTPGAGSVPPALVGREPVTETFVTLLDRVRSSRPHQGILLTGLRGVGKTVLLSEWLNDAERVGARTIFIEASDTGAFLPALAHQVRKSLVKMRPGKAIATAVEHALRVVKSFSLTLGHEGPKFGVEIDPAEGFADTGDPELDMTDLFVALGEAAQERDEPIVFIIDEMQYLDKVELGSLIAAFHRTVQKRFPILVVGGGLPNLRALAGEAKTYSERLFHFAPLGALTQGEVAEAIQGPAIANKARFTDRALEAIYNATNGYPYFVQEWAYDSWNLASTTTTIDVEVVNRASAQVITRLDNGFFQVRLERLTDKELLYLRAMAEGGPDVQRSGAIAERYGQSVQRVGPIRDAMIKRGLIYSPARGETAFSVPLFDGFMRRKHPDLDELRRQAL